jgi:hypothetical protein
VLYQGQRRSHGPSKGGRRSSGCDGVGRSVGFLAKEPETAELWHRRLGHAGYESLAKLAGKKLAEGMKLGAEAFWSEKTTICEPCILGKQTRQPFGDGERERTEILELVHMDMCGPMPEPSKGGSRFFASFTDDVSRLSVVVPIVLKSEVALVVRQVVTRRELQSGKKLKAVYSDRGSEYVNADLAVYFWEKGVAHETTARYFPEQNGVAERLNRVLMEKARAMLVESGLPDEMWAEAVVTANYTRNRTPVTLHGETPWEAFHGKKPNVSHLREFGAPVYMHVPKELRDKLEPVSEKGRFLGYEPDAKAYRILRERDNRVIVSRDVIVDERLAVAEKPGVEIDMGMEEDAAEAFLPAAQRRVRRVEMEPQSDVPENPHGEIVGVEAAAEDVGGQLENEEQRGVRRNPVRERRKPGEW